MIIRIFILFSVLNLSWFDLSGNGLIVSLPQMEVCQEIKSFDWFHFAPLQSEIEIKVSPNPAQDYFTVTANINFSKIQMYNVIGKPLKSFFTSTDNSYQLGDLPGGIYILRFLDANNQVLKTIKLYKKT